MNTYPVACPSCGTCVGSVYIAYQQLKNELLQVEVAGAYDVYRFNKKSLNAEKIFKDLQIDDLCCRTVIMSHITNEQCVPT